MNGYDFRKALIEAGVDPETPEMARHPGTVLREFLQDSGYSQGTLAQKMNVTRTRVNRLINGQRKLSVDTAVRLAVIFPPDASFWLQMQLNHDLLTWYNETVEEAE